MNSQPETAFVPPADAVIDPHVAADVNNVRGMTQLAPRDIPEGEKAVTGFYLVMIDGILHEFPGGGQ